MHLAPVAERTKLGPFPPLLALSRKAKRGPLRLERADDGKSSPSRVTDEGEREKYIEGGGRDAIKKAKGSLDPSQKEERDWTTMEGYEKEGFCISIISFIRLATEAIVEKKVW